jgi:hypothetical protein
MCAGLFVPIDASVFRLIPKVRTLSGERRAFWREQLNLWESVVLSFRGPNW